MTKEEKTELLNRLLEIEEKNDIGNLTRTERGEFQQWVKDALEQEPCGGCINTEPKKIDEWDICGKSAELWIVDGKIQIRHRGAIHNVALPSIQPKPDILDKIRADVINIADGRQSIPVRSVVRIIDKYKTEEE